MMLRSTVAVVSDPARTASVESEMVAKGSEAVSFGSADANYAYNEKRCPFASKCWTDQMVEKIFSL